MTDSTIFAIPLVDSGQASAHVTYAETVNRISALLRGTVLTRGLSAPPGGETNGSIYIVGPSATGDWTGHEDEVTAYFDGWRFVVPEADMRMWVVDEGALLRWSGSAWVGAAKVATGITASTTQAQGQQPLTAEINHVATVANIDDVVTLPAAFAGRRCVVLNRGANALQIFPASGDAIDDGTVDASLSVLAGVNATFEAIDAVDWYLIASA